MDTFIKLTFRLGLVLVILTTMSLESAKASHIVGGEMRYECVGDDLYKILLSLRRDCFNGAPNAQFDKFAYLGVYDANGFLLQNIGQNGVVILIFHPDDTLNEILTSECEVLGEDVCVHTTTYTEVDNRNQTGVIKLPFRKGGYYISYQRCCRNSTLTNIINPLETGSTYFVRITEDALRGCNEAAKFKHWGNIYLCAGDSISYDHSATDADGDSLVYRLCTPYHGASFDEPKKEPAAPPPYDLVNWKPPYGLTNMFGGTALSIDERTGLLTGAPTETGQYLIGLCVEEYREGRLINITRRDFEYNVRVCPSNPIAAFEHDTVICNGYTVNFKNNSSDGIYNWYFDADRDRSITSNERNPSHTYDKSGYYEVVLVAIRDSVCIDSVRSTVFVYGDGNYGADFDFKISNCEKQITLDLTDQSFDLLNVVSNIKWRIVGKNGTITRSGQNVSLTLDESDTLEVTVILTTLNGCSDSLTKLIPVNILEVDFRADNIPICFGESTPLVNNFNPNYVYTWSPGTSLSCTVCPNPTASPLTTTIYNVTVTDGNCSVTKKVKVKVNDILDIDVIGDPIACDSTISLKTNGGVEASVIWASDRDFTKVIASGTYQITLNISSSDTMVYVKAETEAGCKGLDSLFIINKIVDVGYVDEYRVCVGDTFEVVVNNIKIGQNLEFVWTPSQYIVSGGSTNRPKVSIDVPGSYLLEFDVINEFNCTSSGAITITVEDLPKVDFDFKHSCENLVVDFTNLSDAGQYLWDFGDGQSSNEQNPTHQYGGPGTYNVSLFVKGFCENIIEKQITIGFIDDQPNDTIISCDGMPVNIYPSANLSLQYVWHPGRFLDDSTSANPIATVSVTTTFTVTISDPNIPDCYIERSVQVIVPPPIEFILTKDTILCYTDSLLLQSITDMNLNFEWRNGNGVLIGSDREQWVKVLGDETFTVIATDEWGCSKVATVSINPYFLNVEVFAPEILCHGGEATLRIDNLGEGTLKYSWTPLESIVSGANTDRPIVNPVVTTEYTVIITNEDGCVYERKVTVVVSKVNPRPIISAQEDTIYFKMSTQLFLNEMYESYLWVPEDGLSCTDCPDPIASPDVTTTYNVYVTNEDGCVDSATYRIVVILPECNEEDVYIPNVFSPNGDGENDKWRVMSNFIEEMQVVVFNRWGQEVFSTDDVNIGWDGTFNGEFLPPDVYGYRLYVKCVDGQEYVSKGNVTIMK